MCLDSYLLFGVIPCLDPQRPPPRSGKTVRIASPPTERIPISPMSEDEIEGSVFNFHGVAHSNHRGSPPPLSRGNTTSSSDDEDEEEDGDDPFKSNNPDSSGSENEEAVRNTLRQQQRSSWSMTVDPAGLSSANDKKPEDPVHRSITRPMSFAGGSEASLTKGDGDGHGEMGKAALDVDSFKRLLLTGDSSGGQGQGTTMGHRSSTAAGSGESTADTTTNPPRNPAASLPGTQEGTALSKDDPAVNSGNRGKMKPPPPKTRHGRPIKSDEPQTSFSQRPTSQHSSSSLSNSYEPARPSSGSFTDTEKSHPTVPNDSSFTPLTDNRVVQSPPEVSSPVLPQTKRPPTPPLARRQSQLRPSKNALSRSNSARLAQSSTGSGMSTSTRGVPPPPPRRQDRIITPPSDTSLQKGPLPATSGSEYGGEEPASQPLPSRTPSTSSGKQSQPPRPPPPRRLRGSSRSSADSAATSLNPSGDVAKTGEEERSTSNANDILADLSKLQREVDELRGQYQSQTQH